VGVAPTGKAITVAGILIYRIANGKIQEEWDYRDVLGLMQQLVSVLCRLRDRLTVNAQAEPNLDSKPSDRNPYLPMGPKSKEVKEELYSWFQLQDEPLNRHREKR